MATDQALAAPKPLTKEQAAKLVKRTVPVLDDKGKPVLDKDGNVKTKDVAITEKEVFAFADKGDHVVVVTVDGQKFRGVK